MGALYDDGKTYLKWPITQEFIMRVSERNAIFD